MSKKLILSVQTVEDGGYLVNDRVYPEKQYVFTNVRGLYEWLCQQTGVNSKPDSYTTDGRVVVDANKLERLERIEDAARELCQHPYDTDLTIALGRAFG
jgi:hypothetical protein